MSKAEELRKRIDDRLKQHEKEKMELLTNEAIGTVQWIVGQFERRIEEGDLSTRIYCYHGYNEVKECHYIWFEDKNDKKYKYEYEDYKQCFFNVLSEVVKREAGLRIKFVRDYIIVDLK